MCFVDVAFEEGVPDGKTLHIEANVGGWIYAVSERCGNMNASLSKGTLYENIITYPLHRTTFDVRERHFRSPHPPLLLGRCC